MRVPCSLIAVPLLVGSTAGLSFFTLDLLPLCAAAGALLALLAGAAARACGADAQCAACIVAGALAAGLSLGASGATRVYEPRLLEWFDSIEGNRGGPLQLEGVLLEDAAPGPFGVSIALAVSKAAAGGESLDGGATREGGVRLSVAGALARAHVHEWRAGRVVRVSATLREPVAYLNPGVPDDRRSLARRGVVLVGSVKSALLVEIVARGSVVSEAGAAARAWVRRALGDAIGVWDRRSAGIATAILIGDRTGLDKEDERRLQEAGTYHVIAISGGNIAILTAILLIAFRAAGVPSRPAASITIAALLFYGSLTAPAASVDRAVAAACIYLTGRLLDHSGAALNILAVAGAGAIALVPITVFDPGFILSFGATLGILVGVPRLVQYAGKSARVLRLAAGLLAATVAAEIALAPVGATLFSRMTVAGVLLNFAAIPLMTLVQTGSLLVLAVFPTAESLSRPTGYLVHLAAAGLVDSAKFVDLVPWLARETVPPAAWIVAAYYLAVVVVLVGRRYARAGALVAPTAWACMFVGGWPTSRDGLPPPRPGMLRVAFLDVGQGDATVLLLPDGRALLVDAGGFPMPALQDADSGQEPRFDIGGRVVAPALRALGVRRLDTLVITHGDPDHVGGAAAIVRRFRPQAVWEGVPVPPHPGLAALAAAADRIGAGWRTVQAGDRVRMGPVRITALHPPPPEWERQRVRNEDSVVLDVRFGDVSIVLPGDIGREAEPLVASRFTGAPIVVLKAPHHGSATSTTPALLAALQPAAVIFSAGRHGRFGHPAPVVVSRVRQAGAAMFSTAEDGAVILETDGRTVEIRGWTGRRHSLRVRE